MVAEPDGRPTPVPRAADPLQLTATLLLSTLSASLLKQLISVLGAVRAAGLRLRYHADTSAYAVRFYTRLLAVYRERRADFEAMWGPERYLEGLARLQMSQQCAITGVLGQLVCIAEKSTDGCPG
jgi:hypothetical protein